MPIYGIGYTCPKVFKQKMHRQEDTIHFLNDDGFSVFLPPGAGGFAMCRTEQWASLVLSSPGTSERENNAKSSFLTMQTHSAAESAQIPISGKKSILPNGREVNWIVELSMNYHLSHQRLTQLSVWATLLSLWPPSWLSQGFSKGHILRLTIFRRKCWWPPYEPLQGNLFPALPPSQSAP